MIIAVDLDNTIINYTESFIRCALDNRYVSQSWIKKNLAHLNYETNEVKNFFKDYFFFKKKEVKKWEKLQGEVYGKYLNHAKIFAGFYHFMYVCKSREFEIFIISHKTKYGHHEKSKVPLRQSSLNFLIKHKIVGKKYIPKKNIFFYDSVKKKINKINKIRCKFAIDDLKEVFLRRSISSYSKKILFCSYINNKNIRSFNNWNDICYHIFKNLNLKDIKTYGEVTLSQKIKKVTKVVFQGNNSKVFKAETYDKKYFAIKVYLTKFNDNRNRLKNEFKILKFLNKSDFEEVPKAICKNEDLNVAIYEWIQRNKIEKMKARKKIDFLIAFIKKLKKIPIKQLSNTNNASHACFNGFDIENQIIDRFNKINQNQFNSNKFTNFLNKKLKPVIFDLIDSYKNKWPDFFEKSYKPKEMFLSPSDSGFHNIIVFKKRVKFVDFEYSGLDDPAKLTCDFLLHPGMNLHINNKIYWAKNMFKIFSKDKDFKKRVKLSINLFSLIWSLIVLNKFEYINLSYINSQKNMDIYKKFEKKMINKSKNYLYLSKNNFYNNIFNDL